MKKLLFAAAALTGLIATTGCSDNTYNYDLAGQGNVTFRTSFCNDVKVASRADVTAELSESALLWISSANGDTNDGVVRKYKGLSSIPAEGIKLAGGNYVAELWGGDSVSASFEKKYFKARAPFTVTNGSTAVELKGKIANSVVSVEYTPEVAEVLTDMKMTVGHSRGSLTFDSTDPECPSRGYFMMPSTDTDLTWTLTGTKVSDGGTYTRTGTIANAQPTTEYILRVKYTQPTDEVGGAWLDIVIDAAEVGVEDEIVINMPPMIVGYGFDINNTVYGTQFAVGRKSVYVSSAAPLTKVILDSDLLTPIIGGPDGNILFNNATMNAALNAVGINWVYNEDAATGLSNIKINFEAEFLNALDYGDYAIKVIATDSNNKTSEATLNISVSDAKVVADPVDMDDLVNSARSLKFVGTVADDEATDLGFEYRAQGTADWTAVYVNNSRAKGDTFSVVVNDLQPGTTYEYRPICTTPAGRYTGASRTASTEPATQLPNAGFEDWQTSKMPYLIYAGSESNMFWDSGNHGSATMKKNVTLPESNIKHSGNYSAKLASQFVGIGAIGKFAAGNIFTGKYLDTEGTDGILGWGRPFTGRPVALRGWVRYEPANISHIGDGAPAEYVKGQLDKGIIFIALLDDSKVTLNSYTWPVIIRTKEKRFFDSNADNIIAYGEQIFTTKTVGDGLVEFEIKLTYNRTDVRPSNIHITCAASKGGDYFTGGDGSTMYIDDFELVY